MVALECNGFLQNSVAGRPYAYPSLIAKRCLILAIYLTIPGTRAHLRSTAGSRTPEDKQLAGLYRLVFQYAPALLRVAIMVCDCSWYHHTPGTGDVSKRCLQVSLYLIHNVNPQHGEGDYKRALHLALASAPFVAWWTSSTKPGTPKTRPLGVTYHCHQPQWHLDLLIV